MTSYERQVRAELEAIAGNDDDVALASAASRALKEFDVEHVGACLRQGNVSASACVIALLDKAAGR